MFEERKIFKEVRMTWLLESLIGSKQLKAIVGKMVSEEMRVVLKNLREEERLARRGGS